MAMMGLDGGRINIGTCSIGAAQQAFNIAREHVQVSTEIRHLKSACFLSTYHFLVFPSSSSLLVALNK